MQLSEQKIKKLKEMNSDEARLILRFHEYLKEKPVLCESAQIKKMKNIAESGSKKNLNIVFDKNYVASDERFYQIPQTSFMNNTKMKSDETYYYSGKKMKERLNNLVISEELKEKVANVSCVNVILNLEDVSSFPIWNTKMRRKMLAVIEKVNTIDATSMKNSSLRRILENTSREVMKEEKSYELDYVLKVLRYLYDCKKEFTVVYVSAEGILEDEAIMLVNELEKYIKALQLGEKRYSYIYDTVCHDLDHMFSKFGFCDFQKNQCISQRHKNLFKNNYPLPKKNGCCFNVYRTCSHHQKDGSCDTKCLACKLYTCPFLGKLSVGMMTSEILLIRGLFNAKQKRDAIYRFFMTEEKVLKVIKKHQNLEKSRHFSNIM